MFDSNSRITASGATRRAGEWASLPQCPVDEATLLRRLNAGVPAERAIFSASLPEEREKQTGGQSSASQVNDRPTADPEPKRGKWRSKYIGVSKRHGVWFAQVRISRTKVQYLGRFDTEAEAAIAYDFAARPLGKPLNFPGESARHA